MSNRQQIFGKFELMAPPSLRRFERHLRIRGREGLKAWESDYRSVQKFLDRLYRFTRSYGSRETYCNVLRRFCEWSKFNPNELVHLPKSKIESLVHGFVNELAKKDLSLGYLNSVIKKLRTFFRANGFKGKRELEIETFHLPSRYRKKSEYIPTSHDVHAMADAADSTRNRALILCQYQSGTRVSSLLALNYGDVREELENGTVPLKVPIYPDMRSRVAYACKGNIPYYSFISHEAVDAVKAYLRERAEKYGPILDNHPLFHSEWNLWPRGKRTEQRLNRRSVGKIVKKAAKYASLPRWREITPHCLRKSFQSVLRTPTLDGGRVDEGVQAFLFGHILPGSRDAYYDKESVEFHREQFARLNFGHEGSAPRMTDKLVSLQELESHLAQGWLFVSKVSDETVVVRKANPFSK